MFFHTRSYGTVLSKNEFFSITTGTRTRQRKPGLEVPRYTGIKALQYGSIAAKDSWKSTPPVVIEGLGAIAALHCLPYFCRGQSVIDVFLDRKSLVEAWCNKGLEDMDIMDCRIS